MNSTHEDSFVLSESTTDSILVREAPKFDMCFSPIEESILQGKIHLPAVVSEFVYKQTAERKPNKW